MDGQISLVGLGLVGSFDLAGLADVNLWDDEDQIVVDSHYLLDESELELSGLKPSVVHYFGLQGADTRQISERIRLTIPITLQIDQTGLCKVARGPLTFYDRYADDGRDDYSIKGIDVSDDWFEKHILPKLHVGLQTKGE